nr:hypothetical protein [Tanacetum cinerariifolium]
MYIFVILSPVLWVKEKAAKKQKLDEEVAELKRHLQIVPNDDDDVYTEATPLARKVPVVDYEIYTENNKPYYKIIKADGSLQLFQSFLSLLRNFDRKDLEVIWELVKERFASFKPKNFSDDFLLTTLTYMFEKPDVQAQVWKNQRTVHGLAKVKSWRLLESCGVHIITFTSTQIILLVERRYPLSRFTLDQLINTVRLEVEEESEIVELKENFNGMSIEIRKKEKLLQEEQWAYLSTHPSKRLHSFCFDDDDDDDEDYTSAITPDEPVLSTEEPDNSLYQFEDLSESNEEFSSTDDDSFSVDNIDYVEVSPPDSELVSSEVMEIVTPEVGGIKASNDNPIPFYDTSISGTPLNLTPSGKSDFFLEVDAFLAVEDEFTSSQFPKSNLDPEGDMLLFEAFLNDDHSSDFKTKSSSTSLNTLLEETNNFDNSLPECTTFLKVLCNAECESDSKTIISKPLYEEEIIPKESLRTHDSSLPILSKIDSLLVEFAGELTLLKSIPPGIDESDCDFKEYIRLIEKLLYDNSSPCPQEEFVSANSDIATESFSPSPILVKDSHSYGGN